MGWWDNSGAISGCVAAYQPIGAASLAASYSNLANPGTYDASPVVAPTFATATGWAFDGSTQYLTTGITPVNNLTWSMIVRTADEEANGNAVICGGASAQTFCLGGRFTATQAVYISGGFLAPTPIMSTGVLALAGNKAYRNGVAESGTLGSSAGAFGAVLIGRLGASNKFKGKVLAWAIYSSTLTAGEVATLTTLMNALPVASAKGLPIIAHYHRQVWG